MTAAPRPPGPPGPKGWPLVGNLLQLARDPTGFLLDCARRYGDVAYFRLGKIPVFLVSDPERIRAVLHTDARNFTKSRGLELAKSVIGEGLLTAEGDLHRRQRRLAAPAFHRARIESYTEVMVERAEREMASWRTGVSFDVQDAMSRLTLSIVGETLFGVDLDAEAQELSDALGAAMTLFESAGSPLFALRQRLPWLPSQRRFARGLERLDRTMHAIIRARRDDPTAARRGDLLSLLMCARDAAPDAGRSDDGMTDAQLRDEVMTLFLAGHETTANALSWTFHRLARHPEVEARLALELDEVLRGRAPTLEDLPRLDYTQRVLLETMRLNPPVWAIGRRAIADYRLGEWVVPAGATILVSQFVLHRDPRLYADPERFDPERWRAGGPERHPFAYLPFGAGPRACIGNQFAMQEATLVVAAIARRFRLRADPARKVEPQALITLRPRGGLWMTAHRK